jgi:hypothetical protein
MSSLVLQLAVNPEHSLEGDRSSVGNPIALAIIDRLALKITGQDADLVAVGDDEIYLYYQGKSYTCEFDAKKFHSQRPTLKPRVITLRFKHVPFFKQALND